MHFLEIKLEKKLKYIGLIVARQGKDSELLGKPPIKTLNDVKAFCKEINQTDFKVIKTNLAIFNDGPEIYMPGHQIKFENPELELQDNILKEICDWINKFNSYLNEDIYIAVDLNFNFKKRYYKGCQVFRKI